MAKPLFGNIVLAGLGLVSMFTCPLFAQVTVTVSPSATILTAGAEQPFAATVGGTSNTAVNWTIVPTGVGSISIAGLYIAPATITSAQTVTVTATSQADATKSGTAVVTLSTQPAQYDDIPPNFISISTPTGTINASKTQQNISMTAVALDPLSGPASDDGIASGVSYAQILFAGPTCAAPTYFLNYLYLDVLGSFMPGQNQNLSGTLVVPTTATSGTYYACYAYISDVVGNTQAYNNEYGSTSALLQSLPSFQVIAGGALPAPPVLTSFTMSPNSTDATLGSQVITATFNATDNGPGVSPYGSDVELYTVSAAGVYYYVYSVPLTLAGGTSTNGTYQAQMTVPRYSVPGTWMAYVTLCDTNDNCAFYPPSNLQNLGFTSTVAITDANPDTIPPQLKSISLVQGGSALTTNVVMPDSQTLQNPITVTLIASDNLSGVSWYCSSLSVSSTLTTQYHTAYFTANPSSPTTATATFDIPYLGDTGQWNMTIRLCDYDGNTSTYTAPAAQLGLFSSIFVLYQTSSDTQPLQPGTPVCDPTSSACLLIPLPVLINGTPIAGDTVNITVTPSPPPQCTQGGTSCAGVYNGFTATGSPYVSFTFDSANGTPISSPVSLSPPGSTITIPGVAAAGTPESAWASYRLWSIDDGVSHLTPPCAGYTWGPTNVVINPDGSVTYSDVCNFSTFYVLQLTGVPGDVNHDGVINCADIGIVKAAFGTRTGQPLFNVNADVNNDGVVNILDLSFVSVRLTTGTVCK